MKTFPDALAEALTESARTSGERAAIRLLHEHGYWLRRRVFVGAQVDQDGEGRTRIEWETCRRWAERETTDVEAGAVLLIAAGLAGQAYEIPLGHLLEGLGSEAASDVTAAVRDATGLETGVVLTLHAGGGTRLGSSRHWSDDDDF